MLLPRARGVSYPGLGRHGLIWEESGFRALHACMYDLGRPCIESTSCADADTWYSKASSYVSGWSSRHDEARY